MLSWLACVLLAPQATGLATLRRDIQSAWQTHQPNYHRFLSAAYKLAQAGMEGVQWEIVDKALRSQGVRYEPEIDAQHVTTSDSLFKVTIGRQQHDVRLVWLIVEKTSENVATKHMVVGAEVRLTGQPKIPFSTFVRAGHYPKGTVMDVILSTPEMKKIATEYPIVGEINLSYDRSGPSLGMEVSDVQGFPCEFVVYVDMIKNPGPNESGSRPWFRVASGLDRATTLSGEPASGTFESRDTLGPVDVNIGGGWGRHLNPRAPARALFERIGRATSYREPTGVMRVYAVGDLKALPATTTGLRLQGTDLRDSHLALLQRFTNLRSLDVYYQGNMNEPFSAEGLQVLAKLTKLRRLHISGPPIDDETMRVIGNLRDLEDLSVSSAEITDQGVAHLQRLSRLQTLSLGHCKGLSDRFASPLRSLKALRSLSIWWSGKRSDVTLRDLTSLRKLQSLSISGFSLATPIGLRGLINLRDLERLDITDSPADDAFLAKLPTAMPKLRSVTIRGPALVTDAGIQHLARLPDLEWLSIDGCSKVTEKGLGLLAKALGRKFERS